jgi:BolA protein
MSVRDGIEAKLRTALTPDRLEIVDESDRHRGHAGWRAGGETHFRIQVVSARFAGLGRLDRHRLVNAILADELAGPVHALAIQAIAPGEAGAPGQAT